MNQPKNETETHFLLKEVGKYVLWSWGFTMLASEVNGMYSCEDIARPRNKNMKNIIDVVGLKKVRLGKTWNDPMGYEMRGIEAKASYSDFKNGFCVAPRNTYIIAPVGIIPLDELPDKIGLLEVDFNILKIYKQINKVNIDGVNVTRRAKKRNDKRFGSDDQYQSFCRATLESIAYQSSRENLFWRNAIDFSS
jgi:hypothetical protein